jgi:hypothetical protein
MFLPQPHYDTPEEASRALNREMAWVFSAVGAISVVVVVGYVVFLHKLLSVLAAS